MRRFVWLAVLLASSAVAQDKDAEHYRLQGELREMARKSAWSGVERTYLAMVDLEIPLRGSDHLVAAQAAMGRGDALLAMLRLRRITGLPDPAIDDDEGQHALAEALSSLERLSTRYGPVSISVGEGRDPVLDRPAPPFAPDERQAVERTKERLAAERAFRGLLPVGSYLVDGVPFEIQAGEEWQSVVVAAVR